MSETTSDSIFYYMAGGERRGPYSLEQMLQQPIHRQTPAWRKGMEAWTTVGQIPELVELVPPPPPTPMSDPNVAGAFSLGRAGSALDRYVLALRRLNVGMLWLIVGTFVLGMLSGDAFGIVYLLSAAAWLVVLWHAAEAVPVKQPWIWAVTGILPIVSYVPLIVLHNRLKQPLQAAGYRVSFLGKATPPVEVAA